MGKTNQSFTTTGFNVFGEVIEFSLARYRETEVDLAYQQIFNTYGVDNSFQVERFVTFHGYACIVNKG